MAEKRNLDRHRKRMALRFGVEEAMRSAFTEDLSTTGLFIKTAYAPPPGSVITIELTLEDARQVLLVAQVRWVKKVPPQMIHLARKGGMGVKIIRFISGEEDYHLLCEELSLPYAELL